MEDPNNIDAYDLIRSLKHLTKDASPLISPNHCALILNKLFSQNLDESAIKRLIYDINTEIKGDELNSMDDHVLSPFTVYMLINKQLHKYKTEDIFRDLFNSIQKDGVIHKDNIKDFFQIGNINLSEDALVRLCQLHLKMDYTIDTIDYPTFIKLIENYLHKKNKKTI